MRTGKTTPRCGVSRGFGDMELPSGPRRKRRRRFIIASSAPSGKSGVMHGVWGIFHVFRNFLTPERGARSVAASSDLG